jgi:hypothetical protein
MVALPIGLFALLLRVANVRADRRPPHDHQPRQGRGTGDEG